MIWPDSTRYEGQFVNGVMEGRGTKYFANGDRHVGLWSDDKAHGPGTLFKASESSYKEAVWNKGAINAWHYSGKVKSKPSHSDIKPNRRSDKILSEMK